MPRAFLRHRRALLLALLLLGLTVAVCAAREHVDGFDGDQISWKLTHDKSLHVLAHRRHHTTAYHGSGSENIVVETSLPLALLQLEQPLPPSRVIEELRLSLWVRSNRDGATLAVRVVFPRQKDPRTDAPLAVLVEGDSYTKPGTWQKLECRDVEKKLNQKLPLLRRQVFSGAARPSVAGGDLDRRDWYVDRAVVSMSTGRGTTEIFLDELKLGPVTSPLPEGAIQQVAAQQEATANPEVKFRLDRLQFNGKEFVPLMIPYHGEQPADLAGVRLNVAWVPDYRDQGLLQNLRKHGLGVMAMPPRASSSTGGLLDESHASLAPFGDETANILFWNLGTRISGDARRELAAWAEQVRNADRRLQRPLVADVAAQERSYSRQVPMLGTSRHFLHTTVGFKEFRNWLIERRNLAQPGTFLWTWIQTEPLLATADARRVLQASPVVVEPEQIRLQVYAALSAGCRGIGYWTNSALDGDRPGSLERKLMLTQLNMELELLSPWIATGVLQKETPFTAENPQLGKLNQLNLLFGGGEDAGTKNQALLKERINQFERNARLPLELEAATIRSNEYGLLLLPVWYGDGAQYVPGQLAANNAKIIVPGVPTSSSAWEVSTTGIHNLNPKPMTGGRQITLEKFDLTSAVIFTSNHELIAALRQKMESLREKSAQTCLELARAKLERVIDVDRALHQLGVGQSDAPQIFAAAHVEIDKAQTAFQRHDFHGSRLFSQNAMQLLRILQNVYWIDAVRAGKLYQPVSSPHTVCFQTLPDHWRMIARLGRSPNSTDKNLLRSGDFENFETMIAEGWKHQQTPLEGVRAAAELYPRPHQGNYSLRLVALPDTGQEAPLFVEERPVTVTTPPVAVRKGQLVYIGGWLKVVTDTVGNLDGVLLYDSLAGPSGALRWKKIAEWQHFELLREVPESTDLTVTLTLTGLGEAYFDDLQIIPHDPDSTVSLPNKKPPPRFPLTAPLDLLKRIPGVGAK